MKEAALKDTESGRVVDGEGWFVVNLTDARWESARGGGAWSAFETPEHRFAQYGIGVHVLWPGEANGRYHAESDQEDFLVLAGECIAVVEGEERRMRQWDHLHCPPGTAHIFVGAGDGPCAILMAGARTPGKTIDYIPDAVAARYGASVERPTQSPAEAYADLDRTFTPRRAPWPPGHAPP
jgi:uncharacterized cupin superfamily protein